jgi:alanyl-tRNA synthetase
MTKNMFAVLVLLSLQTNIALAQDDVAKKLIELQEQQIQSLKVQVNELKEANKTLTEEIAKLKEEIEQKTTSSTKKPATSKASKLSDILVVGAVFESKSEHIAGPSRGQTGSGIVTITARDRDSFTATSVWGVDRDKPNGTGTLEVKGTIAGNAARWNRVDGPISSAAKATLRPDGQYIDFLSEDAKGTKIKGTWKVP